MNVGGSESEAVWPRGAIRDCKFQGLHDVVEPLGITIFVYSLAGLSPAGFDPPEYAAVLTATCDPLLTSSISANWTKQNVGPQVHGYFELYDDPSDSTRASVQVVL